MVERPDTGRLIHLVNDDDHGRASIAHLLDEEGFRVETWPSGSAFLAEAAHVRSGCVLLDVQISGMSGLAVQDRLRAQGLRFPLIIFTDHADIGIAIQAMRAGAVTLLEKPADRNTLLGAIREAFERLDAADTQEARTARALALIDTLTPREREVLTLLARGLSNRLIGEALGISPRTVEIHRAHLMTKLGTRTLSATLRIAFAAGIEDEAPLP